MGRPPANSGDADAIERVAQYLAGHCNDPRHPRTIEWHAKAHARHAREVVGLIDGVRAVAIEERK